MQERDASLKPFFVPRNSGGGASGGASAGVNEYEKYFARDRESGKRGEEFNLTKQAELAKKDPGMFRTLTEKYKF
jgi:hypothetical protein